MKAQTKNIYWEKQGVDMLCGVHTINNLLQGPFFNEIQLSQIALDLDKKEKQLMMEQGMTKEFLQYMAEDSGNVAMSGHYSIQVLQEALKKFNLSMQSIDVMDKSIDLTSKVGFICHSANHWFALRKIQNVWYNLNSCNKRLPEIISQFYMSAFLMSVEQNGYQIFLVEGEFPYSNQDMFQYYNKNQNWYPALRILRYHEKKMKNKNYTPNIMGAGQDKQLKKAIAASLGKQIKEQISSGQDSDWQNPQKKKQVQMFSGKADTLSGFFEVQYQKFFMSPDDIEMLSFMKMSLEDYFAKEPSEGFIASFRYSNGKKQRRIFPKDAKVQNLYDWVWLKGPTSHDRFYLVHMGSKQPLLELYAPLQYLADEDNQISINVAQKS